MRIKPTLTAAEARHREMLAMTEAELMEQVIELAHLRGWLIAHFRPAKTSKGWRTPVQADGAGWPDLVLAREQDGHGQLIFAELKSTRGQLTAEERGWLWLLATIPCAHTFTWRPADLESGEIERELI